MLDAQDFGFLDPDPQKYADRSGSAKYADPDLRCKILTKNEKKITFKPDYELLKLHDF